MRRGDALYLGAEALRREVLYEPFGIEWVVNGRDDLHPETVHVVAVENGSVVGYGRLVRHEGMPPQIRQLAVAEDARGRGTGSALLTELIGVARDAGDAEVWLDSRIPAVGFYERMGFVREGEEFLHRTGILHVRMAKDLRKP